MPNRNQAETVFNIVKYNPAQRTEQIKIKAMQEGVSCADRYLRWLRESGHVQCCRHEKDRTKTWSWTGKPYFIAKKDHPKTIVEANGQLCLSGAAACICLVSIILLGTPAAAGSWRSGKDMTKSFEGYRERIYICPAGARSIGYGFNIDDAAVRALLSPSVLSGKTTLEKREAERVFDALYKRAQNDASQFVGKQIFRRLSQRQQEILTDMAYNLGSRRLSGFVRMRAAIVVGDYARAAAEMKDSKWYHQTGWRARHHVERFAGL